MEYINLDDIKINGKIIQLKEVSDDKLTISIDNNEDTTNEGGDD